MRKSILSQPAPDAPLTPSTQWLDLHELASAEISSEDPQHPIENALPGGEGGWRAAAPGPQLIRLNFDRPQPIQKIRLEFLEREQERTQEFALSATRASGITEEFVRQQWTFSPDGSVRELEEYTVDLQDVVTLELKIDPGRHDRSAVASLESIRIA